MLYIRNNPIHCCEKGKITPNNQQVLFANNKEGLGYYGFLEGFCKETGKFLVRNINNTLVKTIYIVEYDFIHFKQKTDGI